jgi:hypothetical protein
MIPEAIAMETAAVEIESTDPIVRWSTATAPESWTTIAPKASTEEWANPHVEVVLTLSSVRQ